MKLKILGIAIGGLLALQSANTSAHTDVYVGLDIGIPAPVVVERRPVYYYESAPVYYYGYYDDAYPRHYVHRQRYEARHDERQRHDRGRHRGHHHH